MLTKANLLKFCPNNQKKILPVKIGRIHFQILG